jgi:hypothetical protein
MQTRLVDDPVWLEPDESLLKLANQRLLIVTPSAAMLEVSISIVRSTAGPLQFAVKITNGKPRYLTAEAVKMLKPREGGAGAGLTLIFTG